MTGAEPPQYTGRIDRAPDGTIIGRLVDQFGWEIVITGQRDPDAGGYVLQGRVGEPPASLRIPAIDGEAQ